MLDQYRDLIDELLGAPQALRAMLAHRASPEALGWVALLRDRDRAVHQRLQRLQRETAPHLRALPPVDRLQPEPVPVDQADALLAEFEAARGDLVSLLMNLTLRDWERTATHDEGGIVSLAEEVERHVEFDEEVRARIQALSKKD
jgi:hypothetical protein